MSVLPLKSPGLRAGSCAAMPNAATAPATTRAATAGTERRCAKLMRRSWNDATDSTDVTTVSTSASRYSARASCRWRVGRSGRTSEPSAAWSSVGSGTPPRARAGAAWPPSSLRARGAPEARRATPPDPGTVSCSVRSSRPARHRRGIARASPARRGGGRRREEAHDRRDRRDGGDDRDEDGGDRHPEPPPVQRSDAREAEARDGRGADGGKRREHPARAGAHLVAEGS